MGNISVRQRWIPVTKEEWVAYSKEFGASYVRTVENGTIDEYRIMDIFDGNHRWHATLQLIKEGILDPKKVYFQTAVYDEFLPDVVAELTGRLLNE
jgi:hypothetical protein